MNERIKELLTQSGYDARYCSEDFDPEKFAELIVRECADVAQNNTPDTEECQYTHLVSEAIKQHFGVEE